MIDVEYGQASGDYDHIVCVDRVLLLDNRLDELDGEANFTYRNLFLKLTSLLQFAGSLQTVSCFGSPAAGCRPLSENRQIDTVRKVIITSHGWDAQNLPYV